MDERIKNVFFFSSRMKTPGDHKVRTETIRIEMQEELLSNKVPSYTT